MKLFLIAQNENNEYDTYDSAVVCAENEEVASNMNPANGEATIDWGRSYSAWCSSVEKVEVKYLGEAAKDIKPGIVCASFNPG